METYATPLDPPLFNYSIQKRNFWKAKWVKDRAKWVMEKANR